MNPLAGPHWVQFTQAVPAPLTVGRYWMGRHEAHCRFEVGVGAIDS